MKENMELHKKLQGMELSMRESPGSNTELEQLKKVNRQLYAKISALEKNTPRRELLEEKLQLKELTVSLENCVRTYVESTLAGSSVMNLLETIN